MDNKKVLNDQLTQDQLDQQELDAAYNTANGIKEVENDDVEPNAPAGAKEDVDPSSLLDDLDNTAADPLSEILDEEGTPVKTEDDLDPEKKEDEAYVDLEGSPEDNEEESLIKPDDPVGVQKRISKEVHRRKAVEAEVAALKAQQQQMLQMMMGGQVPQMPGVMNPAMSQVPNMPNGHVAPIPFTPPAPSKPYDEMNDFERFNYLAQAKHAEDQARQAQVQQQQHQSQRQSDIGKVVNALQAHLHDPVIKELYTHNRGHFTDDMLIALADEPNKASLVRYLHTQKNAELSILKNQSPDKQRLGIAKLVARVNFEREQNHTKKAQAKKPAPAGKIKSATLPNNKGNRDIYNSEFLEKLTPEQWDKLAAKGY